MKRWSYHATISLLVGLYKAFVLMHLWNWFVTPVFHTSTISIFQALGLFFIVAVCTDHYQSLEQEFWSNRILAVLDLCVPEGKREQAKRALTKSDETGWFGVGVRHLDDLVSTTAVLLLGWAIHNYLQ
jgi:hypothetical protein